MPPFDNQDGPDALLTSDVEWWRSFEFQLAELVDNDLGQAALWPVDDFVGQRRFMACSRRGTHAKITDCPLCFGDWAWGYAPLTELLAPQPDEP